MEYVYLGRSGLQVSRLCLGTMTYGAWDMDEQSSLAIIDKVLDAGINFLDTADTYGKGTSEQIIGKAIKGRRDKVIVATKFKVRTAEGPNGEGASRYRIMRQVEASLRRLGTDYIDLYQVHRPDPYTPLDETLRALDDLVTQGKVRYIGCSNFEAWRIVESLWISEKMNLERFVTNQPGYHLFNRYIEQEILPACERHGLATLAYSPMAGGWLSGKYRKGQPLPDNSRGERMNPDSPENQAKFDIVEKLAEIANQKQIKLGQLALAWLLRRKDVIPVIGVRHEQQLQDNLAAVEVKLTEEDLQQIDAICPSPYQDFSQDGSFWFNEPRAYRFK
ncbi:aldo/keto reductase [Xylanibacillus composti]|uniref:Aldo/keto reductase n=1 Tax=Xylanibacillus composti TaxID=1572762 RepID=A0A8J4LZU8_9BACL|nr:aldo/keto reductase [Xylanibacillus composti]MDT9726831.1 aldo/keto reductase [Xylanibacillus composti]GIQ67185.1 aldo/keto reductase [Xylanibacillus composti]